MAKNELRKTDDLVDATLLVLQGDWASQLAAAQDDAASRARPVSPSPGSPKAESPAPVARVPPPAVSAKVQTGQRFGPYEVVERAGSSELAEFYKARDTRAKGYVVLKILRHDLAKIPQACREFHRQAEAVSKLSHPNIAKASKAGKTHEGWHYCVLEHVDGWRLKDWLRTHRHLREIEMIKIGIQIAVALDHAWSRSVCQMNVRPDRIVVSRQGRARLVDFGPDRTYVSGHETVGCVWGGVQYISPEQANEDEHVDIRSDIYALGATLFHAATGRPPFADASDTMVSLKHLNARLPLARELNPQLSKTTESLLAKMLARDPNDRYQTPKDLLHDLVPFHARLEAIKERQVASQEHPVAPASPAMEPPPASVSPVQGEVAPAAVPVPDASPEQPSPQPPVPTDMAPEAADGGVPLPASPMAQDVVPGAAEPLPSAKPHVKPPRGRKKVLVVSIIVGALVLAGLLTFLRPAWFPNVFRGFGVTRSAEPPPEDTPPESPP